MLCHWVLITSVLRFIKHIFISNLQSIPPLLKHIFVTFLLSLLETLINSTAKRTPRHILNSRKHFFKPWKLKEVRGSQVRRIRWMV